MTRIGWVLSFLLFVLVAASCGGTEETVTLPSNLPADAMQYTGYDDAGQPVVKGWIRINLVSIQVVPAPPLDGQWHLEALADPATIGPQVGDGVLAGSWVGNDFGAELNPGQADNNVTLLGKLTVGGPAKARYEGRWTWSTIAGPKASGPFLAVGP